MATAYLLAGTNLGDRHANLDFARRSLSRGGRIAKASSYFETEPVGFLDQPWFLNQALEFETTLLPLELLALCQEIESSSGRVRTFPNAPRTLDLDILLYDDAVITGKDLIIPHPRMTDRRFVLEPLAEIAPEFEHPVRRRTIRSLLEICPDRSLVRRAGSDTIA